LLEGTSARLRSLTGKPNDNQTRREFMHTYQCESCDKTVEIEEYEAMFGHHEYYEHGLCQECFDKDDE
jgi:hypothetical protein